MTSIIIKCPYCGGDPKQYFNISSKKFFRCQKCGLIFNSNIKEVDEILNSYREHYFKNYANDQIDGDRNALFEYILDSIEKRKSIGRLLDIGTGCGLFLAIARKRGWKGTGLDPSKDSVKFAKKHLDLDLFWGTLEEYKEDNKYDVISFINVLDHIVEPWKEIELACKFLKPGGLIYVRSPNGAFHSRLFKMILIKRLKQKLYKYLVFHEYCFTKYFIRKFFGNYGFSEIQISISKPSGQYRKYFSKSKSMSSTFSAAFYFVANIIHRFSFEKFLISPSIEITAIKRIPE